MKFLPSDWLVPASPLQCKAHNVTVPCDFALYMNATSLDEDQKLAPNSSITGHLVFYSFLYTGVASILISAALVLDRIAFHRQYGSRNNYWLKTIHTAETILVHLSDQQLASGVALLFTLNGQSCTISAFDFNVVCTMLLISITVHLNALVSTSDYVRRGKIAATLRILSIITQLVLTGVIFSARLSPTFPFNPQPLAITPAACFENANANNDYGLDDLYSFASNVTNATYTAAKSTGNGTETFLHSIKAEVGHTKGMGEFAALAVFVIAALLSLSIEACFSRNFRTRALSWGSIAISSVMTLVGAAFTIYGWWRYHHLISGMHTPQLYQGDKTGPLTFSQILPLAFLASNVLQVFSTFSGPLPDVKRVRRYAKQFEEVQDGTEKLGLTANTEYTRV